MSQLLSTGLSFLYFNLSNPQICRRLPQQPCSGQRRDATKLAPAQGYCPQSAQPFLMYPDQSTGRRKWMRIRVYACVRRTTGWMPGERRSVRPNNLAAFSFLFRLSFPEKTNSIGEEL
ncbi:hypothetical protein BGW80DRAFT_1446217 [Lactifluus volemus]|nr:hypothetical protein BGW80DRAFT_1446217 [Lactifluus volemus]